MPAFVQEQSEVLVDGSEAEHRAREQDQAPELGLHGRFPHAVAQVPEVAPLCRSLDRRRAREGEHGRGGDQRDERTDDEQRGEAQADDRRRKQSAEDLPEDADGLRATHHAGVAPGLAFGVELVEDERLERTRGERALDAPQHEADEIAGEARREPPDDERRCLEALCHGEHVAAGEAVGERTGRHLEREGDE